MSEQKTIKSILMNLHPVQSVAAPVRTRTSLPSGAPGGAERRKIEDEKLRKEEEQQKRLAEKGAKRARMSIQKVNK